MWCASDQAKIWKNKYQFKRKQEHIEGYNGQNVFYTPENGDIGTKINLLAF